MSTNDRKIIRTEHTPTGEKVDFYLSQDASPSVMDKIRKVDELEDKMRQLKGDREQADLSSDEKKEMGKLFADHNRLSLQVFSSILDPVDENDNIGIPKHLKEQFGYKNKHEYISDCAKSQYVISKTINFFYSFLPSSTELQEDRDFRENLEAQVQVVEPSSNTSPSSSEDT